MERIQLSDHFTIKKILRLATSPILMMIFTSLYGIIDGFCISFFSGGDAFAGINLVFPMIMIIGGIGFIFGAGGSALTGKYLGEGKRERANQSFSNILSFTFVLGLIISIFGLRLIEPFVKFMASTTKDSTDEMIKFAVRYGKTLMLGQFMYMIQCLFQSYFVVDEKPKFGFIFTFSAGITNIVFDLLLVPFLSVEGAAIATMLGQFVGGIGPMIYFFTHKNGNIYLAHYPLVFSDIFKATINGLSEFVNNVSSCVVSVIFNIQLLKYYGQNGVSAYGILMYIGFIFFAVFIGYTIAINPAIAFNYGANNRKELKNILRKSFSIIGVLGLIMFISSEALAYPFALVFANNNKELINLTVIAFRIYSIIFIFCGFSMFISSFFTALNNGSISGIISFLRCLVFQIGAVVTLPVLMNNGIGIWWSIVFAETAALIVSFIYLLTKRKKYEYF